MPKTHRHLTGDALNNYRMLSGIWGIYEDFNFDLDEISAHHLNALYISATTQNLLWLTDQKRNDSDGETLEKEIDKLVPSLKKYITAWERQQELEKQLVKQGTKE